MTKDESDCGNGSLDNFVSLCCFCGERKSDVFGTCNKCGFSPKSNDQLILSALLTTVFTSEEQLYRTGERIKQGNYPSMTSEVRDLFMGFLEDEGMLIQNESS